MTTVIFLKMILCVFAVPSAALTGLATGAKALVPMMLTAVRICLVFYAPIRQQYLDVKDVVCWGEITVTKLLKKLMLIHF